MHGRLINTVFTLGLLLTPLSQAGLLHEAAKSGNLRDLKTLLSQGQAVNQQDEKGNTPLHYAVAEGQVEAAVLLLKQPGVAVDQRNHNNETPLHMAGTRGRPFIASRLIEQGAEVNVQDNHGKTPTCNAASAGHPEFLKLMISKGAAINAQPVEVDGYLTSNIQPTSDALVCAVTGKQRPIIDLLLEKGVEISSYAVAAAITSMDRELVSVLLGKGGRVDYRMLVYGSERDRGISDRDYLQFILDRDRGSRQRATPLIFNALGSGDRNRVAELLDLGINVNGRDLYGNTPLHRVAEYGSVEMCKLLLGKGASVKERTERGNTPLHKAIGTGNVEVAKLLIESQSSLNARNEIGNTPLHMAAARGQEDLIRLMLRKGADKTIKNERGLTAGQLAKERGHVDLARLLGVVALAPSPAVSTPTQQNTQSVQSQPIYRETISGVFSTAISSSPLFSTPSPLSMSQPATVSSELQIKAQPQAENGAVVPVTISVPSGLRAGDQLALYVNNDQAAMISSAGSVLVSGFTTRVRMTESGEVQARLKRKEGSNFFATTNVLVTTACQIPDRGSGNAKIFAKSRPSRQGGTEILILHTHLMSRAAYVRQLQMALPNGSVEIELSPRISKDPLIGVSVLQPVEGTQVRSYIQGS